MWKNRKVGADADKGQTPPPANDSRHFLSDLDPRQDEYASLVVERLLLRAVQTQASDIHLEPMGGKVRIRYRVDGVLTELGTIPTGQTTSIANRLKGLAKLLTYRTDIPQEGRLVVRGSELEARVVTLPTLHGERIVIRLAAQSGKAWLPLDLGLPPPVLERVERALLEPSGVLLFAGTAGAGKTTSAYACLRAIASQQHAHSRSIVTLEDPIEIEIPHIAQSQIQPNVGYDWASGLKAILRQDPEVVFIGEIRDAETALTAFQASMTGQLVVSTMHARNTCDALRRLLDMQVPKHQICNKLRLLVCQRLVRRLCDCAGTVRSQVSKFDAVSQPMQAPSVYDGCDRCDYSGYRGRLLLAEVLPELDQLLVSGLHDGEIDSYQLQLLAAQLGMQTLAQCADLMVKKGLTTLQEVGRV